MAKKIIPGTNIPLFGEDGSLNVWVIKYQATALRPTPIAGMQEFDGTGMWLTLYDCRRFISLASDSAIATVEATTVALTNLWTGVVNANEFKPGRVYVITGCGLFTTHDAADQATITVKLGAATIITLTTPQGLVTDAPWHFEAFFTMRTTGAAGTVSSFGEVVASTGETYGVTESSAVDTTAINNITVNCEWSDISNSLKLTQCWLDVKVGGV